MQNVLLEVAKSEKRIELVIVDSKSSENCRNVVERLNKAGIKVTYTQLNGVPFILEKVSKVMLGAVSMFSNGFMMAEAGSAAIASLASAKKIPVISVCETFKFSNKVVVDTFVSDET